MQSSLGLGKSSAHGERGVTKRLHGLARQSDLRGDRMLDVGCGDGIYTVRLAENFERVDAIDIQADRIELFRVRLQDNANSDHFTVREMSVDQLDYDDDTFDLVTAIEVLEHVVDLDHALREIQRVLKPGGRFAFTTPNRWFPFETHGVLYRGRRYSPARAPFLTWIGPLHQRFSDARTFTAHELRRRLSAVGLRIQAVDYIMPPFDRSAIGKRMRPVTDRMEQTPMRFLGMAMIVTAEKPLPNARQ
jgi:SAM-dependent methyltransferase